MTKKLQLNTLLSHLPSYVVKRAMLTAIDSKHRSLVVISSQYKSIPLFFFNLGYERYGNYIPFTVEERILKYNLLRQMDNTSRYITIRDDPYFINDHPQLLADVEKYYEIYPYIKKISRALNKLQRMPTLSNKVMFDHYDKYMGIVKDNKKHLEVLAALQGQPQ